MTALCLSIVLRDTSRLQGYSGLGGIRCLPYFALCSCIKSTYDQKQVLVVSDCSTGVESEHALPGAPRPRCCGCGWQRVLDPAPRGLAYTTACGRLGCAKLSA